MSSLRVDTVFRNGSVFDGYRRRRGLSVAVAGGRVVAVGEDSEVRSRLAAGHQDFDLDGGLLAPGFHDAHMHPMVGGLERLRCELNSLSAAEEYLDAIAEMVRRRPNDAWVRGGGWSVNAFDSHGPRSEQLDQIVPDRPAFLPSSDHHDAWVNSRALELAGIDSSTPDPPDGWIERDDSGHPTGTLREGAMSLVWDLVETTQQEYDDALRTAQRDLHAWGITGWHDALIGGYAALDDPTQSYLNLIAQGELTARVRCSQWWDRSRTDATAQAEELVARRDELSRQGLDAGSVKVMMDGIAETYTAALTEGYDDLHGCPCGDHGLPFLSHEQAVEAICALDAAGLQVHVHAIGDAAVHQALDAFEEARRRHGLNDARHQVAHLQLVRPEDRPRFGDLQVVANLQGMWVSRATPAVALLEPHLDEERRSWQYPFRDLLANDAHFCGGSDWPVNPPEPIGAVHALVNRRPWAPDSSRLVDRLVPEQAITLEEAFSAYSRGSAWVDHHADGGFIRVGARADLVTLDRDPFDHPPEEIGAGQVVSTWAGGQLVHHA